MCYRRPEEYGVPNILQLHLTPAEADRLRNVSYQRQLEAGMRNPGRAGLTADRLGDSALWVPQEERMVADGGSMGSATK